ncbi:hypothetical protein LCL96_04095 [Rossellomorea aquimaris]|uniref:hypothetical protein n=1 Tax=Rossellomorea aquimaris TaxID=189382 RepID=UPI001CD3A6D5|nr:hypothetical protein [Rossellomorea aquimaris]MCA1058098.1 hypothetical protein [Rossellomorea aquimaris]
MMQVVIADDRPKWQQIEDREMACITLSKTLHLEEYTFVVPMSNHDFETSI